ncbi:YdgA family protein [Glaesserella parasuis]|nr:YdgA family protein [Glaesserella parasuis]
MKLTKITLALAGILGVAVVGGSWYTGLQAEQHYQQLVQQGNQSLKSLKIYGIDAEIKDVKFERHFFSSDVKYTLEVGTVDERYQLQGDDKLFHGPLPLNRLSQVNLMPAMMSVESKLYLPEKFKLQTPFTEGQTDISHAGNLSGEFSLNAFKGETWDLAKTQIEFEYDPAQKSGKFSSQIPSYQYQDQTNTRIEIQDTLYKADFTSNEKYPELSLGNYEFSSKMVRYSSDGKAPFAFTNLSSQGKNTLEKDRWTSTGSLTGELLAQDKLNLGKLNIDSSAELDAESANELMHYASSLEKLESVEAGDVVLSLLNKSPKLQIKELSLENAKGKNSLSLNLNLDKFDPSQFNGMEDVLKIFKASVLETQFKLPSLELFMAQLNQLDGFPKEDAEQKAKQTISEFAYQAQASSLATSDKDSLKMKLSIDQGKVNLNGRDVPEAAVQGALFMIMLGLNH